MLSQHEIQPLSRFFLLFKVGLLLMLLRKLGHVFLRSDMITGQIKYQEFVAKDLNDNYRDEIKSS